jgi:hypothetical protein
MFVEWKAKVARIDHKKNDDGSENGMVSLMLQIVEDADTFLWAYGSVPLNDNRELNIVRRDSIIKVVGEIEDIEGHDFRLKDVSLHFD